MSQEYYSLKKVAAIFGGPHLKSRILEMEQAELIPKSQKYRSGAIFRQGWTINQLPLIGEKIGYFKKFSEPTALAVFTTKGGVLKSTLALNLARTAALHGLKTCVVGLDIQGDVTTALGFENDLEKQSSLEEIIDKLNRTKGLSDLFNGQVRLQDIITTTDLDNLFLIPETPELVALNDSLSTINRREFWLKEKVVDHLKDCFDLVIMDCSPNWNKLTTNALVACDALVSPLECKINNFRNFKVFRHFLTEFKNEMRMNFESIFVPTRYSTNRKLSIDIHSWYKENVEGCADNGVRESVMGEEATALNKSLIEHAHSKPIAKEMRELLIEIHSRIEKSIDERAMSNNGAHFNNNASRSQFSSQPWN